MESSKDLLTCGICNASFSFLSFAKFIEHKMLHVDANKQVYCCLCMRTFPKRNSLQSHLKRIHAIPQKLPDCSSVEVKGISSDPSSARCKPCVRLIEGGFSSNENNMEIPILLKNQNDNDCSDMFSQGTSKGVQSIKQINDEGLENSNSSVDVLSTDGCLTGFTLNLLCQDENDDVNRSSTCDQSSRKVEHDADVANHSSNSQVKDSMASDMHNDNIKQNGEVQIPPKVSFQKIEEINEKGGNKVLDLKSKSKSTNADNNIDFHFLLGTTNIKGNSMTYERVEFRCMHCSFSSAWRPSLVKHMKAAHNDVLAFHEILDIQNSQMLTENELSKKYKIIKLSEHSKMTYINKLRAKSKRRTRPIENQDIPGKYTCPVCNKVFSRVRYIRRHQMTHRTQRSYLCDNCGKSFKTKATLVAHSRSHNIKVYHCPQCDFVSNLTGAIHRHRQLHPNGSVVCDICGAAYIDKSTLKKHRRVHDQSRPFPCPNSNCTWRFKSESLMKAHAKSHDIEGKFLCSYCGYRFRHKHHLQRHISRIHPQDSLLENPATHSDLALASSIHVTPSVSVMPSNISILPENQKQEILLDCDKSNNGVLKSVIDSQVILPFHTQTDLHDRNELKSEQSLIQLLVNNNGQEIVINLQPENNVDLSSNGNVSLEYENADVNHINLSQIYTIKDLANN